MALPVGDEGEVIPGLVEHLSANSINLYLRCPRRYWHEKILQLRPLPDAGLVAGSAFHAAVERTLYLQVNEQVKVSGDETLAYAADDVKERAEAAELDEPVDNIVDKAVRLTRAWALEVQPKLKPVAVEVPWTRMAGDVKVIGRFDLEETDGIRDWKTAGRTPVNDRAFGSVQAEIYSWADGKLRPITFTYFIDLKGGVKIIDQRIDTQVQLRFLARAAELTIKDAAEGIRRGLFPRRRDGWHCSAKWCPWYGPCILGQPYPDGQKHLEP